MGQVRVVLDPGHGGHDSGANGPTGLHEKDVALRIARTAGYLLGEVGYAVGMTRDSDTFIELMDRARFANNRKADLFVSLHCNGALDPKAKGLEVWTTPGQTDADHLAESILCFMSTIFPAAKIRADLTDGDRDKERSLSVLRNTRMPAVLVEMGFITNPEEERKFRDPEYCDEMASAICQGIEIYARDKLNR